MCGGVYVCVLSMKYFKRRGTFQERQLTVFKLIKQKLPAYYYVVNLLDIK